MNVLWISPFLLHPTRSGGQIRSLGILRQLQQRNNIHVVAFQLPGQEEGVARMNEYCTSADRIPHILPNGFDVDSFPEVRREPAKSGEIVLGTVGHLRSEKR